MVFVDRLLELSTARAIAGAVAGGELSPREVAGAVLARIEDTDGHIAAFSQFDGGRVLSQAEELTKESAAGQSRGPLHGVPVAVKEWFNVAGFPTLLKGADAESEDEDATVVARLRAAGALIVGKTHVPLGGKPPPTRNPWNLAHTPGGSSSGAAAAVAARMVPLSIGEQTSGSNLRPAAFCGVGAIKPTYGLVSRYGMYPAIWSRDHPGIIGLDMDDIALCLSVVAGHDPRDPLTTNQPAPSADLVTGGVAPPRIGMVRNFFPERTQPLMLEAVEKGVGCLEEAGAEVIDVTLPQQFSLVWDATELVVAELAVARANQWAAAGPVTVADVTPSGLTTGTKVTSRRVAELIPAIYYIQARRIRTWLRNLTQALLADLQLDALIMAVTPEPAPYGLESTGDTVLLDPWSFLGMPTITVNAGLSHDQLPIGLQLVAASHRDLQLMRTGRWCEQALGLLPPPNTLKKIGAN